MNNLILTKGLVSRNGAVEPAVQGAIRVFLQNAYNSDTPLESRTVTVGDKQRTVVTANASLKVDELMSKQLNYFFGKDVPEGEFVRFRVQLWGKPGDNLMRFNAKKGDLYLFFIKDLRVNNFTRKNGAEGFSLDATAYAFEPVTAKKANGGTNNGQTANPADHSAQKRQNTQAPSYPAQTEYDSDDFAAVDDSDDLPF